MAAESDSPAIAPSRTFAVGAAGSPAAVTLCSVTKQQPFIDNEDDRVRGFAQHGNTRLTACSLALIVALLLVGPAAAGTGAGTGTRSHPYKRGTVVKMKDGFWVRVVSVDRHAWRRLMSQSRSNRPPRLGETYVMVTIRATNHGKEQGLPFVDGLLEAVGPSHARYDPFEDGCGVIPSDVENIGAVAPGATAVANACWEVDSSDAASLLMDYTPYAGAGSSFFALR